MRPRRAPFLLGLLSTLLLADPVRAQEIAGTAVDSAGRPLPDVPVALHRVGGGSGASVAAATTDAEGRFRFTIEAVDSAVYFVAMRHGNALYIGPPVRGGVERVTDYVLRAAPGTEAGAVASALGGGPLPPGAASPGVGAPGVAGDGAVWFVVILALAVATVFVTTAPRYRRRRRRELVLELARIENRLAAAGPGADTAADQRRRAALRERLTHPA
ncbi:MAG TPA: carboxypeptidase-like regulatory domain-containing protein [Longimicrobiales bacterium]|nr:carboxypeptidase-like regulatory domain-containing protein [Longimicrobiales bacterium]